MPTGNPWLDLILKAVAWGLAVFIGAYLAQKAQHRALKEDIEQILRRAQAEAEAKKRGETEAVQKDLQLILGQLRETTALTKQIEADISYKVWDQQMRLTFKRDLYIRLLEVMGEKIRTLYNFISLENALSDSRSDRREARQQKQREVCDANDNLSSTFQTVIAVAGISLPSDACDVLDRHAAQCRQLGQEENMTRVQKAAAEAALFQEAFNQIGFFAKRDVGNGGNS